MVSSFVFFYWTVFRGVAKAETIGHNRWPGADGHVLPMKDDLNFMSRVLYSIGFLHVVRGHLTGGPQATPNIYVLTDFNIKYANRKNHKFSICFLFQSLESIRNLPLGNAK